MLQLDSTYLGPTLLKDIDARKNKKAVLECNLQEKCLQAFRAQERKVNEVKALGKPYEVLKVDEVKVLVMWYRQAKNKTYQYQQQSRCFWLVSARPVIVAIEIHLHFQIRAL